MTIDVGEPVDVSVWAPLPTHDRLLVGGHTVWIDVPSTPAIVTQPNRWGVIEGGFPSVPCLVECDPEVIAELPQPTDVVGFVDRSHQPVNPADFGTHAKQLIDAAERLTKRLTQIRGVKILARPFARTVPLVTPRDGAALAGLCASDGLVGLRPLEEVGGGIALTVRSRHTSGDFDRIVDIIAAHAGR